MTDAEMWAELSRGCCSRHTVIEKGCATCAGQLAALDRVKAIIAAADALRDSLRDGGYVSDHARPIAAFDRARGAK